MQGAFSQFALLLLISAIAGAVAIRLRQPLLIAYIVVGIVVGPAVLGFVDTQHQIDLLAQIGVTVLLFVVGLKGDGTTSVVVLTGELLGKAVDLMDKKIHPTVIIDGYRDAQEQALKILNDLSIKVKSNDKKVLKKIASTSMASKLISGHADYLSDISVEAISQITEKNNGKTIADLDMVKIEKKPGGSMTDTKLINGLVIVKEVSHSDMPKVVKAAKIGLLNAALEIEKTEFDSKISIETPDQMQAYLDQRPRLQGRRPARSPRAAQGGRGAG